MIVLKIGGDIIKEGLNPTLVTDIKELAKDKQLVIVHGGGDEVTETAEKLGKPQKFIVSPSGIRSRYTDKETVSIYSMVMAGKINKETVAFLLSRGVPAFGLSGVDGTLLRAKRKRRLIVVDERGRRRIIEGGYTGKIGQVNAKAVRLLVKQGYVPVVAPVAIGKEFELLNVDSDRAAAHIAGALGAEKIVFLTDVKGVLVNKKLAKKLSATEAEEMLPKIGPGMDKKVLASTEALKMGVKEAIIAPGDIENPLTQAINRRSGTVITPE